jgi:2-keto-3-deoxy-L-rhamnonate aldolase RhmA
MINGFKRAIAAREPQLGISSSLTSNLLAEIMGDAGFDWILFDTEHASNDLRKLIGQLQAIRGTSVHAMVRHAANDPVLKRVLDIGFPNVLAPFVQTAEDAALAVTATRYPPNGIRGVSAYLRNNGYGRIKSYFEDNITVAVQIEIKEAIANLQSIAATLASMRYLLAPEISRRVSGIWAKSATLMFKTRPAQSAKRPLPQACLLASSPEMPKMPSAIWPGDLLS